jgi:hypothetical protein
MTPIRDKLFKKLGRSFGDSPPGWARAGDLGIADSNPAYICNGLNLRGFQGKGEDWTQDIADALRLAFRSRILYGLYSEPTVSYNRSTIKVNAAADVVKFSPAVAMRMIKSTLWAAEQQGKIAMPSRLKVRIDGSLIQIGL